MNKRIVLIFTILLLIIGTLPLTSNAAELNIKVNANINVTKVEKNEQLVEITISLGDFKDIKTLGYQATLEYDKNMFESVTVTGENGWTTTYDSTKSTKIVADTASAKANTEITKITLKLKEGLKDKTTGKILLKDLILTDGTDESKFSKEFSVTFQNENQENNNTNNETNTNTNVNNNANQNTTNSTNNTVNSAVDNSVNNIGNNVISKNNVNIDNTTSNSKLPAAGLKNIIVLAIFTVATSAIIFKIKSKKIKY